MNPLVLLTSIILARSLYVAADFDIAEKLQLRHQTVYELAQSTQTDPPSLERMLYFLSLHDLFEKDAEGKYKNTQASEVMLASHPQSIKPFLLHDDPTRWNCFGNLGYSIKAGKPAFDNLYATDYFSYTKQNPVLNTRFNEAMTVISHQEDHLIAKIIPFTGVVVDIGGGQGQLLDAIMIQNSAVSSGILFDLPTVVAGAIIQNPKIEAIGGSFFEPLTIDGDIFILKRILHDWDDEKSIQILRNIAARMKSGSQLLIIEGILDKVSNPKALAAVDLALLSIFGGKERTMVDFEKLAQGAGFKIESIMPVTDLVCAISCSKN